MCTNKFFKIKMKVKRPLRVGMEEGDRQVEGPKAQEPESSQRDERTRQGDRAAALIQATGRGVGARIGPFYVISQGKPCRNIATK